MVDFLLTSFPGSSLGTCYPEAPASLLLFTEGGPSAYCVPRADSRNEVEITRQGCSYSWERYRVSLRSF
jgi:hypothetical protein